MAVVRDAIKKHPDTGDPVNLTQVGSAIAGDANNRMAFGDVPNSTGAVVIFNVTAVECLI